MCAKFQKEIPCLAKRPVVAVGLGVASPPRYARYFGDLRITRTARIKIPYIHRRANDLTLKILR
jgi:hypothetical protein